MATHSYSCLTQCTLLLGVFLTSAPSCVKQEEKAQPPSSHVHAQPEVPSSYPLEVALFTSMAMCMPLDAVNLLMWQKASPETKHALVCLTSLMGPENRRALSGRRPTLAWRTECLSYACWSLPTPDPCHPKGNSTANVKIHIASQSILSFVGEMFLYS